MRKNIAIIGAGVAGLVSAYLLSKKHDVSIFEANSYIGGHTHTISVTEGTREYWVDTGFIVLNDKTYPGMQILLKSLGIEPKYTDMSFAYYDPTLGIQYAGTDLNGLFADRKNLLNPRFYKFLFNIKKFANSAINYLQNHQSEELLLRDFFIKYKISEDVIEWYVLPMAAAIWSAPTDQIMDFPAETLIKFFMNHGLLNIKDRPRWQVVPGGSHTYVKKILSKLEKPPIQEKVLKIQRSNKVKLLTANKEYEFDEVIVACHANQALQILGDPTELETNLLGAWEYEKNETILHYDTDILPQNTRAHASWNFLRSESDKLTVTYDMKRLQMLDSSNHYLVSLNCKEYIKPDKIIGSYDYEHPRYTFKSILAQRRLKEINPVKNTWYCGSYFGYGFHEDAIQSAFSVAKEFGITL